MDKFSNLLQLANFPMPRGGPMMPGGGSMYPPAMAGMGGGTYGGQNEFMPFMGQFGHAPLGGGFGGPMMPNGNQPIGLRPSPFGNGGYGMNNFAMMNQLGRGSGYGGY